MFKIGSQVGIQNARLFNGVGVVEAYVNVGGNRPKWMPPKWRATSGEYVLVRCGDGKLRRYSNGDIEKVVSLEGKSKEELKAFGIGTTLTLGGLTLRATDGAEIYRQGDVIEVVTPAGFNTPGTTVRIAIETPYQERRAGTVVDDPSEDDDE